ncbi:hypothetical protein ACQY0O_006769 [Thecaphora frezii]
MVGGGGLPGGGAPRAPDRRLVGRAYVRTRPALQLPLLSLGTLGAQAVWSIDMAFAPPYLLELGLSKSAMAAVFIAGPLSGLVVQPLIGAVADNSTSKHGRRRPLLAIGAVICCAAVLMLGFARELASLFAAAGSATHASVSVCIAVIAVYVVDFSINAVTALNRALMIDVASIEDQAAANAWAARLSGAGSVVSFLIGNLDLPTIFPSVFGRTQIQILSVITCLFVVSTHVIVLLLVQEQVLVRSAPRNGDRQRCFGLAHIARDLTRQARHLPEPIMAIFKIQFFAWIGWFPIMFYTTVWVGDIYRRSHPAPSRPIGKLPGDEALFEEATRVGSRAMFWSAVVTFVVSVLLPLVVPSPLGDSPRAAAPRFLRGLERLRSRCPDLLFWWVFSHFIFFCAMMGTWIASLSQSVFFATLLISLTGFCWCVTNWVPFGLLGILIQHHAPEAHVMSERNSGSRSGALLSNDGQPAGDLDDNASEDGTDGLEAVLVAHPHLDSGHNEGHVSSSSGTSDHSGSILGLHNLAVVLPQFVVTMASSAIFAFVEPNQDGDKRPTVPAAPAAGHGTPGVAPSDDGDAVGIVLRLGGVSALVAGVLAVRFARKYGHLLSE